MNVFKKIFISMVSFCLLAVFAGTFYGCAINDDMQVYILSSNTMTVEVGESAELHYTVNPKDSLVSFKKYGADIFDCFKQGDKNYIKGLKVGVAQLQLSATYKQEKYSFTIEINVVEKENPPSQSEEKPQPPITPGGDEGDEKDPDVPQNPDKNDETETNPDDNKQPEDKDEESDKVLDAENRIAITYEDNGDGYISGEQIFVKGELNYLSLCLKEGIERGEFQVYIKKGDTLTEPPSFGINEYQLPYAGETYSIIIEVIDLDTNIKYAKMFEVLFEID